MDIESASSIAAAITSRHAELGIVLGDLSADDLAAQSLLPGWDRLTLVCHLRYGAEASHAMTLDVLADRDTAFYPNGRTKQRRLTLALRNGEKPRDAVASLIEASATLDALWAALDPEQWHMVAREPANNPDLGAATLSLLAILRLTEVEVHGLDLDLGLSRWSDVFVDAALPTRVQWLARRRSNHGRVDASIHGTWILRATNGPSFGITAAPSGVSTFKGRGEGGHTEISGTKHQLLAFMIGRLNLSALSVSGDADLAESFNIAFPAP